MNRVFIFPGQGSQAIGMGKELYENFVVAKEVFQEADEALSEKLSQVIFYGTEEELTKTHNTQPALMVVSVAHVRVIEHLLGKKIHEFCKSAAGHSLGQYSAICANRGISVGECAKVLRSRGLFMQNACAEGRGAMAAIIGASKKDLSEVLVQAQKYGICDIANDNSNEQVVISGTTEAIDYAITSFKEKNIKAIKLKVSAPFHSGLMLPAAQKMKVVLENCNFNNSSIPIIDNVTLKETSDMEWMKISLIDQIAGKVRWRETMDIITSKYDSVFEIGSGKVLSNLFKKSHPEFNAQAINNIGDIENFVKSI